MYTLWLSNSALGIYTTEINAYSFINNSPKQEII